LASTNVVKLIDVFTFVASMEHGEEPSLCAESAKVIARTRWKLLAKVLTGHLCIIV
jgi:hypothetical protein